jgi:hypothetical protein
MAPHHLSQVGLPVPAIAFAFVHLGVLVCRRCSVLALFISARKESADNIRIHTCDFVMSRSPSAAVVVPRALHLLRVRPLDRRSQLRQELFLQLTPFRSPRAWLEPLPRRQRRPHPAHHPPSIIPRQGLRGVPECSRATHPRLHRSSRSRQQDVSVEPTATKCRPRRSNAYPRANPCGVVSIYQGMVRNIHTLLLIHTAQES